MNPERDVEEGIGGRLRPRPPAALPDEDPNPLIARAREPERLGLRSDEATDLRRGQLLGREAVDLRDEPGWDARCELHSTRLPPRRSRECFEGVPNLCRSVQVTLCYLEARAAATGVVAKIAA